MTPTQFAHKFKVSFKGRWKQLRENHQIILKEPIIDIIDYEKVWGLFDGEFQEDLSMCGVGDIIIFIQLIICF
jgi:hypothetical protein